MNKKKIWMLIAQASNPDIALVAPTAAWIAEQAGADFECYLEDHRDGKLFARSGSTILGGRQFEHFNYLNAVADVSYILYGDSVVFSSSLKAFQADILAETDEPEQLYSTLLEKAGIYEQPEILLCPDGPVEIAHGKFLDILPYLYTDIYFSRCLAYPLRCMPKKGECKVIFPPCGQSFESSFPVIDTVCSDDTYGSLTLRIAKRNISYARGIAFGDPPAILSQIPTLCREKRIAVFGKVKHLPKKAIVYNDYTEAASEINAETADLCEMVGNNVLLGRQTGDGDLFEWGKRGICIQIVDPNRPTFPVVQTIPHIWKSKSSSIYDEEPDDAQLEKYAKEGKILAGLIFHSGEIAHNEAMLNLVEYCSITGLKLGIAVHAARYQSCSQAWELIQVPIESGGAFGLIDPILHSGGMGIMAEHRCPPELLTLHCNNALKAIREISGKQNIPLGYYAFCDTDLNTLQDINPLLFSAVKESGLEYFVSSARPGLNRILFQDNNFSVINQSTRCQCYGSPFVRINSIENLRENCSKSVPGWILTTMDAPVVSFNPYIWKRGNRFVEIADYFLQGGAIINATPHTIARYARILDKLGYLPST